MKALFSHFKHLKITFCAMSKKNLNLTVRVSFWKTRIIIRPVREGPGAQGSWHMCAVQFTKNSGKSDDETSHGNYKNANFEKLTITQRFSCSDIY